MAQRHICPSMGSIRRVCFVESPRSWQCTSRAFSNSAQTLEEQPSNPSASTSAPATPNSRRARSATAFKQITNLQNRSGPPANQMAQRRVPRAGSPTSTSPTGSDGSKPQMAKFAGRPTNPAGAPSGARMVRAPGTLNITRTAAGSMPGPNLGARRGGTPRSPARGGSGGRDQGPKRRQKREKTEKSTSSDSTLIADHDAGSLLSDGMVHQLLRLQRKEWDRVPYEPKYGQGSLAAQQLIHEGREFFRGESPPVNIWGELERRIGVVGMHGAEAQLKVRRVLDGDAAPFGHEAEQDLPTEKKTPTMR